MVVNFSNLDFNERPILVLKNAGGTPLGVLGYAKNVAVDLKYNETSTIEFELPAYVDGEVVPFYDDIAGMRTVELVGIGQFTLVNPTENNEGVLRSKYCRGYSLEYEFVYKKITLSEDTYKFWDALNPTDTLLGMIMELMPSWSVGRVSSSLLNKYRTFEVSNENLYNLIKGTVQKSYGCIFDFDSMTRTVHVRDVSDESSEKSVFISPENLAKTIEVSENTEDIVTRLDVNGAEGVTIRDVNPCGTNKIINLDYYMTTANFSQSIIDKYYKWKTTLQDNRQSYYSLSVQYALKVTQRVTEMAKLTDLKGELTSLENVQAVIIQGIAQGLKKQADLDEVNNDIAQKNAEIRAQENLIDSIAKEQEDIMAQLKAITTACNFESYFTSDEFKQLDRYIKDGEITDSTFVVSEVDSYSDDSTGSAITNKAVSFSGGVVTHVKDAAGNDLYEISGGKMNVAGDLSANVISAIIDYKQNAKFVITAYLSSGTISGGDFPSACVSLTGDASGSSFSDSAVSITVKSGYRYFTLDASEYEKRSVAWELYEYGEEMLDMLSRPSYTFNVTSANFLALNDFEKFKNELELGQKVYIDLMDAGVLRPITIGVKFAYDDPDSMELQFSDSYVSGDSTFRLVDLLEKSISMGKNVEMSKYIYSSFVDSGASTGIREFITSALDVAKNAIMSSTDQAISWDGAGLRLRKWANDAHTAYEPEQIWMNNNSIVMTSNNWTTAEMAMGKFHDDNLGDCWGIVAPRIVGTMLAGGAMIIESAKKDGGTAVFRVDGDGCKIYNSDLSIANEKSHIVLNPSVGFVMGEFPVYNVSESGAVTIDTDKAKFWVDTAGNLHFKGTLHGVNGDFEGAVTATSLTIKENGKSQSINQYVANHSSVTNAQKSADNAQSFAESVWNGSKGIYFQSSSVSELALNTNVGLKITGKDGTYFQVKNDAMGFFKSDGTAMLYYQNGNLTLSGIIAASGGYIGGAGGWTIGQNCIYNGGASTLSSAGGIYLGTSGISVGSAITMKPDGSFIIRGDNSSSGDTNYVLKISPYQNTDGETVYQLMLGNITFDGSFVLPIENGGTGGVGRDDIGRAIGIFRVRSSSEMSTLPNAVNGDLCILNSEGAEGVSISGVYTTSTTTSPGFLAIGTYNAAGHRNTNYFDITGIAYWNIANLSGESVSTSYARVGVGDTISGACGLYVPLRISASGAVTSVTISFQFALRPANCSRDLCSSWDNGVNVSLYRGGSSAKVATTTYVIPDSYKTKNSTIRTVTVTLNSSAGITAGEYYVAFYTRSTHSLMWIIPSSVKIEGKSIGTVDGLYLRSGNIWKSIASSENYGITYVLPAATASALGGVKIGSNITRANDGTISLSRDNVIAALGYTPPTSSGSSVSISNRLTAGTRIATLTISGTNYDLYAPTSDGSSTVVYPISVDSGGTGATTAKNALINLGIKYSATGLPATANDGEIYLVPV